MRQSGPGGPDALRVGEAADPVPGPGELLIDVAAAGVNRADVLQREGRYPTPAISRPIMSPAPQYLHRVPVAS